MRMRRPCHVTTTTTTTTTTTGGVDQSVCLLAAGEEFRLAATVVVPDVALANVSGAARQAGDVRRLRAPVVPLAADGVLPLVHVVSSVVL